MYATFMDIAENSWTIIKMRKPEGKPFQKIFRAGKSEARNRKLMTSLGRDDLFSIFQCSSNFRCWFIKTFYGRAGLVFRRAPTFLSNSRPSIFSDKSPDRTKVKSVVIPGQLNGSTGSGSEFRASEPDKKMGRNTGPTHTRKLRLIRVFMLMLVILLLTQKF